MNEKKWLADQFEANRAHLRAAAYRASGYRKKVAAERPASVAGGGGII